MKRRWHKLPPQVRRDIIRLAAQGLSRDEIRLQIDCAVGTVVNVLRPLGGVYRPVMWKVSTARLGLAERVDIRIGVERGWSLRRIAASLGRSPSTVSREVEANGGRAVISRSPRTTGRVCSPSGRSRSSWPAVRRCSSG